MPLTPHIQELGRSAMGSHALSTAAAADAFGTLLDGRAGDLQTGAFLLAVRVKGETVDERAGFLQALQARCKPIPSDRPVVLLPSYGGARRLPNLTPLLAMALAQQGARVLVHGPTHDAARVISAAVLHNLGLPPCEHVDAVHSRWARRQPAFVSAEFLCPGLQRLLDLRQTLGLSNCAHAVARLLQPVAGAPTLRVVDSALPASARLMALWVQRNGADAMLLRGTEGEPVADARRQPRLEVWLSGQLRSELTVPAQEGMLTEFPLLPPGIDASTTALYIQAVIGGEKPMPAPVARQAALLLQVLEMLAGPLPLERTA